MYFGITLYLYAMVHKTLYEVLVGTETLAYQDIISVRRIGCILEPIDHILEDNMNVRVESGPEFLRYTTFGFYKMLNEGVVDVVHSLFVAPAFINFVKSEFLEIRDNRQDFICSEFFNKTIIEANKIANGLDIPDTKNDEVLSSYYKNIMQRKWLALSLLYAAIEVSSNSDIGVTGLPHISGVKEMDSYLSIKTDEVSELSSKYPKQIHRKKFFTSARKVYYKLQKHV